jgi:hypothetical protein
MTLAAKGPQYRLWRVLLAECSTSNGPDAVYASCHALDLGGVCPNTIYLLARLTCT